MNLIICNTPLQVFIAEKIIDMHPEKSFFGVMLHPVENQKFDYYKQRLKNKTTVFFSMYYHNDRINLLKDILEVKRQFKNKRFEHVFVSSITELPIQFLLSSIKFKVLNTFDDGTINIVKNSPFLKDEPKTIIRNTINLLLQNKYNTQKLRSLSEVHYTIYPGMPNIIENTVDVPLIDIQIIENIAQEPINILLGQPVYLEKDKNIELAENVIKQFDIHYYLPHPRETYQLKGIEYIHTPLIFEDYITQQATKNKYRIYTYFSSAILNVMNKSPNIEVVALRIDTDNQSFIDCYTLFEQTGIPIIDIRE